MVVMQLQTMTRYVSSADRSQVNSLLIVVFGRGSEGVLLLSGRGNTIVG